MDLRHHHFTDESLYTESQDGDNSTIQWENVTKISRKKEYYLLYISGTTFYYLPFEAFENQQDLETFEAFRKSQFGAG